MARRGENIHKRKDGRWEGRYIKARTPDRRICWGYIYGTTYAEVKQRLIHKKSEYGGFQLIDANKDTFKMYTDMFLTEYIILAIHLNSQGALSDMVLNKVKENANLMV